MRRAYPVGLALVAAPAVVEAQTVVPLPPADLGQTNILDGEGGPGGLAEVIATGSLANRLSDGNGDSVPGDPHQRTAAVILHPIYSSKEKIAGAFPGFEILVPISYVRNELGPGASGSASGLGDVTVAPFMQWSGDQSNPKRLSVRAAVQIVAPTGSRDSDAPVNIGSGSWQISPYVAVSKRLSAKWEISGRIIVDRSGTASPTDGAVTRRRVRAGSFAVLNLSTSMEVAPSLRLGVGGYSLRQLTRSRIDGEPTGGHQRVSAIGPVARWQFSGMTMFVAAYGEFGAHERPSGLNFNLRLQVPL